MTLTATSDGAVALNAPGDCRVAITERCEFPMLYAAMRSLQRPNMTDKG